MATKEFIEYQKEWCKRNSERLKEYRRKWHQENKVRRRVRAKERYGEAPEIYTAKAKRTRDRNSKEVNLRPRLKEYGITRCDFEKLVDLADGKCTICKKSFVRSPHIDHDHKTGKVRELLCNKCNLGLGYFGDDISTLVRAAMYVQKHKRP